ncbi:MAG TPA: thioredoxin family protein [Thermoplasmata archaeon]|nr:thioredoxin family protein [Thermoplasmata archaeon]
MSGVPRIGPEAFDGARLGRPGVWAVEFLADWCPYCRDFAPRFEALGAMGANLLAVDLSDLGSPLWERFGIDIVPTVLVFQDGAIVVRADGVPMEGLGPSDLAAIRAALETRGGMAASSAGRRAPRTRDRP